MALREITNYSRIALQCPLFVIKGDSNGVRPELRAVLPGMPALHPRVARAGRSIQFLTLAKVFSLCIQRRERLPTDLGSRVPVQALGSRVPPGDVPFSVE